MLKVLFIYFFLKRLSNWGVHIRNLLSNGRAFAESFRSETIVLYDLWIWKKGLARFRARPSKLAEDATVPSRVVRVR